MTTDDARKLIGVFGKIHANGCDYPQWVYGRITEVDRTSIWFVDNHSLGHLFKTSKVVAFEPRALRKISWKMPKIFYPC